MLNFTIHTTTEIIFGRGIEEQIGPKLKEIGAHRVLVHFGGSSARSSGLLDRVEQSLFRGGDYALAFKSFNPPAMGRSWVNRYVLQPRAGKRVVHATYRDLGFAARPDGAFDMYSAGGLGGNPRLGVKVAEAVAPDQILYYIKAMWLTFRALI